MQAVSQETILLDTDAFKLDDSKVLKIQSDTKVVYNPSLKVKPVNSHADIYMMGQYFYMKSPSVSMYKDSVDMFFVVHGPRRIMWSRTGKTFDQAKFLGVARALQDSFINKAQSVQCKTDTLKWEINYNSKNRTNAGICWSYSHQECSA
jgi:hypothetical protein